MRHPYYVLRAAVRELTFADECFLAASTGQGPIQIRKFLQEPFETTHFAPKICDVETVLTGKVDAT